MQHGTTIKRVALLSIPVSLLIFALKYSAYLFTDSLALYSDALESIINVVSSIIVFWSIHISTKPADSDHPFGHYKAEYFCAGFISFLIIASAGMILYCAISTLISRSYGFSFHLGLWINSLAAVLNGFWALYLWRQGKKHRSQALMADAKHIFMDVMTSLAVLLILLAVYFTGWLILDPLIAILIALNILREGWKILYHAVQGLMDIGLSFEETAQVKNIISRNAVGALEAHDLKTRQAGSVIFIEFHLVVDSQMSVGDSHAICDRIEEALKKELPYAQVLIHVEPEGEAKLPLGTKAVPFI